MSIDTIKRAFVGKLTPAEIKRYIQITFSIYVLLLFVSWALYPAELNYSIMTHTMSYLGNYHDSPGWIFFTLAMVFMGITAQPLISYIAVSLREINPWADRFSTLTFRFAAILTIFVGLLPDTEDGSLVMRLHIWVATLSLVCYAVSAGFYWWRGRNVYPRHIVYRLGTLYYAILATIVITQIISRSIGYPYPGPGIFSFTMYEWISFFVFLFFFYSFVLCLPGEEEREKIGESGSISVESA